MKRACVGAYFNKRFLPVAVPRGCDLTDGGRNEEFAIARRASSTLVGV